MELEEVKLLINRHENRIHTANLHPRNSFFMEVLKDSANKIKMLKGEIPNPIIECDDCNWNGHKVKLLITKQCPNCYSLSTISK